MIFTTEIKAIDPKDGDLKTWAGPNIDAISYTFAEQHLQRNGLGYCEITGQLISEIDEFTGEKKDFDFENN